MNLDEAVDCLICVKHSNRLAIRAIVFLVGICLRVGLNPIRHNLETTLPQSIVFRNSYQRVDRIIGMSNAIALSQWVLFSGDFDHSSFSGVYRITAASKPKWYERESNAWVSYLPA